MTALAAAALGVLVSAAPVSADVPEYTVMRTAGKIVVDGVLDEEDWEKAEPVGEFAFPWWKSGEKERTEAKMLWNDDFLYVAFTCEDKHIWADHYDTNSWTYKDDAAEIFWNPNPEAGRKYYMFEMNSIGNLLSVHNDFEHSFTDREARVMVPRIGRTVRGTVNDDSDTDSGWTLEVAIRFSDYPELSKRERPLPGDVWRVGLNRCGGKTNPQYSQWSPSHTDRPNFHVPEDFGRIVFSAATAGEDVGVEEDGAFSTPGEIILYGNTPNPFNPATSIRFAVAGGRFVTLSVYGVDGRLVRRLFSGTAAPGEHTVVWDGLDGDGVPVSSGVYLARLRSGDTALARRMLLLK